MPTDKDAVENAAPTSRKAGSTSKRFKGLRTKLVQLILATLVVSGVGSLAAVVLIQVRSEAQSLAATEAQIRASLEDKGRVLAKSHAIALTDLANDNAFTAMNALVGQTVHEDSDLVYGLFLSAEGEPLAYFAPNAQHGSDGLPDPQKQQDAWKVLRLGEQEVAVKAPTVRRLQVFDVEVVEFAAPVLDEDTALGTIRYGVSTERMRMALADARQLSSHALKRTVMILGGIVALTTFAIVLLGLGAAARITSPLAILSQAADRLAKGDRSVHVRIDSGDELEHLGHSFNTMVDELKHSYDNLESLNKTLEERVAARTASLLARNEEMRVVLDTVEQGLVGIYPDGTLSAERSAAFDRWFPAPEGVDSFSAVVGGANEQQRLQLELAWESLVDGFLPLELALDQLPGHLKIDDQHYSFDYQPRFKDERLEYVLLVVSNVTAEVERVRAEANQQEQLHIFQRVTQDRFGFVEFFNEAQRLAEDILDVTRDDREQLLRDIHTLKGNCAIFGVESVARVCHHVESMMVDESRSLVDSERAKLGAAWTAFADRVRELLGDEDGHVVEVSYDELQRLIRRAQSTPGAEAIVLQLERLEYEPIKQRFARVARQVRLLAERLGRAEVEVHVEHNDMRLPAERWSQFWSAFAHVIRNAVDHGIETPAERLQAHKPPLASIKLSARVENDTFVIAIQDDGRGIDWERIAVKARALQVPWETQAELTAALFTDGVSSRSDVTETSGRGVGLGAVRRACETLEGRIEILTSRGQGTTMLFRFPAARIYRSLSASSYPGARPSLAPRSLPLGA